MSIYRDMTRAGYGILIHVCLYTCINLAQTHYDAQNYMSARLCTLFPFFKSHTQFAEAIGCMHPAKWLQCSCTYMWLYRVPRMQPNQLSGCSGLVGGEIANTKG